MSYQDDEGGSSLGSKAMDIGKMMARRAIKHIAKRLLKQLVKLIAKLLAKVLVKLLLALVALLGIPGLIIVLCVILFVGVAVFMHKDAGWIDETSPITKAEVQSRYNSAAQSTGDEDRLRVPTYIIQSLDALKILKEGKKPHEIDPESISQGLTVEKTFENRENVTTTWYVSDGNRSSDSVAKSPIKLLTEIKSWNRKFKYTYIQLTDSSVYSSSSSTSCSADGKGTYSSSSSNSTSNWVQDGVSNSGELTTYSYKVLSSYSSGDGSSYEVSCTESSSSSSSSHTDTTKWVLSTILEIPDYEKFHNTLLKYNYTKGDFAILKDAIRENDSSLSSISGYDPNSLPADATDRFLSDGDGSGGGSNGGGQIPDSPDIPTSSDWGFPTLTKAILGSPYGWRYDDTKGKEALHKGQDIRRTPEDRNNNVDYAIYTVADGTVEWAGSRSDGYGYSVVINHGDGVKTRYAHMAAGTLQVNANDQIRKGKALGIMGQTGLSDGIHLHFEVIVNGSPVNPIGYIHR